MERMVGSGSEPTYQPRVSYTSCAGFVLYFFGAANSAEAVPRITTRSIAVFVNMVVSPFCGGAPYFAGARYGRQTLRRGWLNDIDLRYMGLRYSMDDCSSRNGAA